MGRPIGGKNKRRSPEEKEAIVQEYLNGRIGYRVIARTYEVESSLLKSWINKYRENGIEGLRSKTGKNAKPNAGKYDRNLSEIEKLKRELLKKEIEIERLKKGYLVKGGGAQKEFVTIFDANTKSSKN